MSKPLTFGELEIGDTFVSFPQDGDDEGHGGYRAGAWVYRKIQLIPKREAWEGPGDNARRIHDGVIVNCPDQMEVYKVLL